jgi:hypothetical protein
VSSPSILEKRTALLTLSRRFIGISNRVDYTPLTLLAGCP